MGVAAAIFLLGSAWPPEPASYFRHFLPAVFLAGAVELMGYFSYELDLFPLPVLLLAAPA
jgi:hypothetical protein